MSGPNGHPEPADATLFHEMGHAEHNASGTNRQWETTGDGWENREEQQTIEHGANTPGGQNIPGVPSSPSENDYLGDRDYPYIRTDHGNGFSNPDGTPLEGSVKDATGIIFFKDCFTRTGESKAMGDHIDLWNKGTTQTYSDPSNDSKQVWFWHLLL